jgi:hypothetical protein
VAGDFIDDDQQFGNQFVHELLAGLVEDYLSVEPGLMFRLGLVAGRVVELDFLRNSRHA